MQTGDEEEGLDVPPDDDEHDVDLEDFEEDELDDSDDDLDSDELHDERR